MWALPKGHLSDDPQRITLVIPAAQIDNGVQMVGKIMKIPDKIPLITASLCLAAAAICVGLYLVHRNHAPGNYGRNLEFRLAACNTGHLDRSSRAPVGFDVFSGSLTQEIIESGNPPAGFEWLPLSELLVNQGGGVQPRCITRVIHGREYLLVSNWPATSLTHAANAPRWGVKSAKTTTTYKFGPVVKAVQIELDYNAARLLRKFTQRYVGYSVAVVVGGQVIMNGTFLNPFKGDVLGFRFPQSEQSQAERLLESLMK